jgi:ADP-L-glycero-D-manno-heptose 6-epimerase
MKILITGSKGFIGQNMVNALKDEYELVFYNWGDNLPYLNGISICVHLGGLSSTTETDVDKILTMNYDFSRWLLGECQRFGVNFQYASSASVYGLGENFQEDAPVDPRSPYAWSKYLFERYVHQYRDRWKYPVQGFRYFNVYGPYEDHKGDQASPYSKFTKQAQETGVITLFEGSDSFKRDFVSVEKIVKVHKHFFNIPDSGIWNIGSGVAKSFKEVAEEVAKKYNAKIEYIPMPKAVSLHYQKYTCADLTKLNKYYNHD